MNLAFAVLESDLAGTSRYINLGVASWYDLAREILGLSEPISGECALPTPRLSLAGALTRVVGAVTDNCGPRLSPLVSDSPAALADFVALRSS